MPEEPGPERSECAIATIINRYNEIVFQLADEPHKFEPVFWERPGGTVIAADWAEGFWDGMKLQLAEWRSITAAPAKAQLLLPILIYCIDAEGRSLFGLSYDDEARTLETAYLDIPRVLPQLREFYMPQRVAAAKAFAKSAAPRRRRRR